MNETHNDPHALALAALAETLGDSRRAHRFLDLTGIGTDELRARAATLTDARRAERFLSLTGLSPDGIRSRLADRSLLAACIAFLEGHEPDLIAVAEDVGVKPEAIVRAKTELE